jgi:hypothetical protein
VVNPSTNPPATPAPGEFDLGGVVYVSGLTSEYSPSANPFGGELQLHFTVRNVSSATFSSTARFWVDGPFGLMLGESDDVAISDLKPSEIRLVSATVHGVGQWTFVNAHATYTPPKNVAGVELTSVTRDSFVFFLPWMLLAIGVIGAAAFAVSRILRELESEGALVGKPA